jgi:protease I
MARRAVVLVERGFQDEEFVYPYYRMLEEGWSVDVATPRGDVVYGKYGVPAKASVSLESLGRYEVVVIPGGFESPDRLRMRADVQDFVWRAFYAGSLIAAICHGPWVCISAGIVRGKRVTGYESIKADLKNAGGTLSGERVAVDGNLITAQHYRDNHEFMKAVVAWKKVEWGLELCGAAASNL